MDLVHKKLREIAALVFEGDKHWEHIVSEIEGYMPNLLKKIQSLPAGNDIVQSVLTDEDGADRLARLLVNGAIKYRGETGAISQYDVRKYRERLQPVKRTLQ